MMCDEQFSYLNNLLESVATRVPKIILHKAEEIFPSLKRTSQNCYKIKTENDVDVLSVEDSVGLRIDEVYSLSTFSITKNSDKIKTENDVDELSVEDSVGLRIDEVYTPSAFPTTKDEWKNCMDLVKDDSHSDSDMSQDGNVVIKVKAEDVSDIKIEEHPVSITKQVMKDEQEVCPLKCQLSSCVSVHPNEKSPF
ncbi:uncharacterized protein LOC110839884 isoform X3 [Zootermopsis nevadensis]|uniref:uncharacterized protein LOC110839884 isoform X3 n=1 Tax=Zootermopsis nevadensis TaxID=136037 RepID=UPI000B8E235C|nr:uncharacterized protein LOC110839884 isoform X3 [Zootermopsis nevadensis]